jgi:ferric-dicitrate binding protein FerR (iron transport regulator)
LPDRRGHFCFRGHVSGRGGCRDRQGRADRRPRPGWPPRQIGQHATEIHLGPSSQLQIDTFIAEAGGVIYLDGAIVFDRAETAPKIDLEFQTDFGRIGVRGTRFFVGPSENAFAVFVDRGSVEVSGGGVTRNLAAGQGVNMRGKDLAPGPVEDWQDARTKAAFDWVLGAT